MEQRVSIFDSHELDRHGRPLSPRLAQLQQAASRLHASHQKVSPRPHAAARRESSPPRVEREAQRVRRRASGHVDQLIAAAASVVWVAGFVQTIVDEIMGEELEQ